MSFDELQGYLDAYINPVDFQFIFFFLICCLALVSYSLQHHQLTMYIETKQNNWSWMGLIALLN